MNFYQHSPEQINQLADALEDPDLDMNGLGWKAAFHLRELQRRIFELEAQLYAAPQPTENLRCKSTRKRLATLWGYEKARQPLTNEQIIAIADNARAAESGDAGYILPIAFARAIEAATAKQPARQPLTEDQLRDALRQCPHDTTENLRVRWLYAKDFARAIEAAHGITGKEVEIPKELLK